MKHEAQRQTGSRTVSLAERAMFLKGLTPRLSLVHFGSRKSVGTEPRAVFARVSAWRNPLTYR